MIITGPNGWWLVAIEAIGVSGFLFCMYHLTKR